MKTRRTVGGTTGIFKFYADERVDHCHISIEIDGKRKGNIITPDLDTLMDLKKILSKCWLSSHTHKVSQKDE